MSHLQKRTRTRVPVQFQAFVECADQPVYVVTKDLSLKGVRCEAEDLPKVNPGDFCTLAMTLGEDIPIIIHSVVVRQDEGSMALAFRDMDVRSFAHLRQIVRHASKDADSIDAEIGQSCSII